MLERSRQALAGGVSSPFRAKAPVPLFFEDGHGVRLRDVDGNEYIDYQLAWGPMILGYAHPAMVERLRRAVEKPLSYGAQHEIEISVAEKIQSMVPCAERVAFTSSERSRNSRIVWRAPSHSEVRRPLSRLDRFGSTQLLSQLEQAGPPMRRT
jgi:4-aminobutyrate aminotransferase-like enzyme